MELGNLGHGATGSVTFVVRVDTLLEAIVNRIYNQATIGNEQGESDITLPDNDSSTTVIVESPDEVDPPIPDTDPPTAEEPGPQPTSPLQMYIPAVYHAFIADNGATNATIGRPAKGTAVGTRYEFKV